MKIFAHRGNGISGLHENSLEAFKQIQSLPIDGIELDVHYTIDEQWIVNHDFWMFGKMISKTSSDKLQKLAEERETSILFFSEALDNIKTEINVEIKTNSKRAGFELAKYLDNSKFPKTFISSFKIRSLRGARDYSEKTRLSFISLIPNPWQWKKYHHQLNLHSINPYFRFLPNRIVRSLHGINTEIHTWTVDNPKHLKSLQEKSIEAVITNDPRALLTEQANLNKSSN